MDREYLEDYEQKEKEEYERLEKRIREGKFDFKVERYPPDDRFVKLQEPIAYASHQARMLTNIWAQVPFCGSLIVTISAVPQNAFEQGFCNVSEIPKLIEFIKETGKLQVTLQDWPLRYEGLDYLDTIFEELHPPMLFCIPPSFFAGEKEILETAVTFNTLGKVKYLDFARRISVSSSAISLLISRSQQIYQFLKLGRYTIAEEIENLMIDDPAKALTCIEMCEAFIHNPVTSLLPDLFNFSLEQIKDTKVLPLVYRPQELRFPCEIGKFLLKKLTYAAQDMRACYELMDNYDAYDLRKVQESLNEGIVTNQTDIVNKSTEEFSEILDNVWTDPTIPIRIKNLKRGIPMSVAAIGTAVSAFTGGIEGFLAGLGFSVGAKFLDAEIEGLSERLVKFFAGSYQANVYDFKKKYKDRIVRTQKKDQD